MSLGRRVGDDYAAECARQVELVTDWIINKEKFYIISVYRFLFYALKYIGHELQVYYLFAVRTYMNMLNEWI